MTYSIDTDREDLLTLAEFARNLPGGAVHVATVHRWRIKGVRGIKLPTILVGGVRRTSKQAGAWWFAATTAAADGGDIVTRTNRQRETAVAAPGI